MKIRRHKWNVTRTSNRDGRNRFINTCWSCGECGANVHYIVRQRNNDSPKGAGSSKPSDKIMKVNNIVMCCDAMKLVNVELVLSE